jgi:hypothetical protein
MARMRYSITLDEVDVARLARKLRASSSRVGLMFGWAADPVTDFIAWFGGQVAQQAVADAPKDTGRMAKGVVFVWQGQAGKVYTRGAKYASYVDTGTVAHWVPVRALYGWARRHNMNPYAVQWSIAHREDYADRTDWFTGAIDTVARRELAPGMRRVLAPMLQRGWSAL